MLAAFDSTSAFSNVPHHRYNLAEVELRRDGMNLLCIATDNRKKPLLKLRFTHLGVLSTWHKELQKGIEWAMCRNPQGVGSNLNAEYVDLVITRERDKWERETYAWVRRY